MRCVLGWGSLLAAQSLRGHGDLGHQSLLCHPSRQLRPPRQPATEEDSPRAGLGSIHGAGARARGVHPGGVLRVSVLGGFGVLKAGSWRYSGAQGVYLGCVPGVQTRHTRAVSSGCDLGVLSGFTLGVQPWAGSPAVNSRRFWAQAWGAGSGRALRGALPELGGGGRAPLRGSVATRGRLSADGCLFQEMALACGRSYRCERLSQRACAGAHEGEPGRAAKGHRGRIGGPPRSGRGCAVTSPSSAVPWWGHG